MPNPPVGVMDMLPDRVCEITSPEHESKDLVTHLMRLQTYQVPYYWIVSSENKTLIAYEWVGEYYRVAFSKECTEGEDCQMCIYSPISRTGD